MPLVENPRVAQDALPHRVVVLVSLEGMICMVRFIGNRKESNKSKAKLNWYLMIVSEEDTGGNKI